MYCIYVSKWLDSFSHSAQKCVHPWLKKSSSRPVLVLILSDQSVPSLLTQSVSPQRPGVHNKHCAGIFASYAIAVAQNWPLLNVCSTFLESVGKVLILSSQHLMAQASKSMRCLLISASGVDGVTLSLTWSWHVSTHRFRLSWNLKVHIVLWWCHLKSLTGAWCTAWYSREQKLGRGIKSGFLRE